MQKETEAGKARRRSRIMGCFLGGAIGDALGAPVEFLSLARIREKYGPEGVTTYPAGSERPGVFTDDTQMTLWTAEGLIRADNRFADRGICNPLMVMHTAYLRWLNTQGYAWNEISPEWDQPGGWLITNQVLHARRGPGNTCLSALLSGDMGSLEEPINNSKGCGGVMRVAPVGLAAEEPFQMGAEVAALTHGHATGYLAAGALALIINRLLEGDGLEAAIEAAREELKHWKRYGETSRAIRKACKLAAIHPSPTPELVETLGQGWVAEEALAISLYCALTAKDFRSGVVAAVNHSGDSDSTGAITGNLLGTSLGFEALPKDLLDGLEARELVEEVARDFASHFPSEKEAGDWEKYPTW